MDKREEVPRELLLVGAVLVGIIGAIALAVATFYRPSPRPSPYGCYQAIGSPLIRLTTRYVFVPGSARPRRLVKLERDNAGLAVDVYNDQPYATFLDGTPAIPELDLPPDERMIVLDERHTTPSLLLTIKGTAVTLPKVECRGRT